MQRSEKSISRLFGPSSFERLREMQRFIDRFYEDRARSGQERATERTHVRVQRS